MNTLDILKYGNNTLISTLEGVPQAHWGTSGVCGVWSVKDIVAHLTSYELFLGDVLTTFLDGGPTPTMQAMGEMGHANFNDAQVELRQGNSPAEILAEYKAAHSRVMGLAGQIPAETFRKNGTIPWYGDDYDLDDLIVYNNYAHKREHCAEINHFRDQLD